MSAKIIDGKELSKIVKAEVKSRVEQLVTDHGSAPQLSVILVGENPASLSYVTSKGKACKRAGIDSRTYHLPENTSPAEVLELLDELNNNKTVSGILVQLPLPSQFDEDKIINRIDPDKDVDGLHPVNSGRLVKNTCTLVPCTPAGIMRLLDHYQVEIKGKNAVIIGRSDIVGKPVSLLLLHRHATITICHSRTQNIADIARNADILIAAVGKPAFVNDSFIKNGAVVIDVGINRVTKDEAWDSLLTAGTSSAADFEKKGYTIVGDVDYDAVSSVAGAITPVPGGVGPMTIAMLLQNTVLAYCQQKGILS